MPPRKGPSKAEAGSTPAGRPSKKPASKAAAPKSTASKAATPKAQKTDATPKAASSTKASASSNRPTLTPSSVNKPDKKSTTTKATPAASEKSTKPGGAPSARKSQKKSSNANAAAAAAPKVGPWDRPTLPGEIPPESQGRYLGLLGYTPEEAAKSPSTKATKATKANTSRKRRSSSSTDDEVEPVATRTAKKRVKMDSGSSKRKATADTNRRARKTRKVDEQDNHSDRDGPDDQEVDAVKPVRPRQRPAATSAAAPARKPAASKASQVNKDVKKEVKKEAKKEPPVKYQAGVQINFAPTQPLDVFIFGAGESGELGLGNKKIDGKKPVNVKRPRLHPLLPAETVGVVQIACGGMHSVALTKDNKILTWGVNDQGALGRDTTWDGGLRDADAEDNEDNQNAFESLNPIECTPTEVNTKNIIEGTKFTKVVASDSASFALTEHGRLYGWGTFRSSDGILGFTKDTLVQFEPVLLTESKNIVDIVAGNNHVITLDSKGKVQTWGAPEMNQLGRRVVQRDMVASALRPGGLSFKRGIKIVKIACGSYHSFAIDDLGRLYAWGLNNYGELGLDEHVGEDGGTVLEPTLVESLADYSIGEIAGGEHHSVACSEEGKLLVWGRIDGRQTGLTADKFNQDNTVYDEHGKPRILTVPTEQEGFDNVVSVACGIDNSFAITQDGKAYSWGFSANYQTGQGNREDDVEVPTLIDNAAIRDKKILSAGAGGQFSVLTSIHEDA